MSSKLLKTLGHFDFFGVQPTLYYKGGGKSKSWFGSTCSYLMIGYIIIAILYSFSDMVMRKNPKVVASVVKRDLTSVPLSSSGFNLGVSFVNATAGTFVNDPSIATLEIFSLDFTYDKVSGNITGSDIKNAPYDACTPDHFNNAFSDRGSCINKDQNIKLHSLKLGLLKYIKRCDNNTNNSVICKSNEFIDKIYSSHYLYMVYPQYLITPDDYNNPISIQKAIQGTKGTVSLTKELNFELQEYEVHTDSGYIFQDIRIEKFLQLEKMWIDTSVDGKNEHIINVYMLEQKTVLKRNYPKIQEAFAGTVALVKIGFLACVFLIVPCAKINTFQQLISSIFHDSNDLSNSQSTFKKLNNLKFTVNEEEHTSSKYGNLQTSSVMGTDSPLNSSVNYSPKGQQNKILQNAILLNNKKQCTKNVQQQQPIDDQELKNEQLKFKSQESSDRSEIAEEIIDQSKIVIHFDEKNNGGNDNKLENQQQTEKHIIPPQINKDQDAQEPKIEEPNRNFILLTKIPQKKNQLCYYGHDLNFLVQKINKAINLSKDKLLLSKNYLQ